MAGTSPGGCGMGDIAELATTGGPEWAQEESTLLCVSHALLCEFLRVIEFILCPLWLMVKWLYVLVQAKNYCVSIV